MKRVARFALIFSALLCKAQSATMRIGTIDFFGTSGVDTEALVAALPLHPGETVSEASFDRLKQQVNSAVVRVIGQPATDIAGTCCDASGAFMIYLGLPGENSRALRHLPRPTGSACLPARAVDLYTKMLAALDNAVRQNDAMEDDSKGYALSHNAALRDTQLAIHTYAVRHATLLETAIRECRTAENRQAAAQILGYATRSNAQIAALVRASKDSDATVRNNAVRALWVIASSAPNSRKLIPALPYVAMLSSDKWEDRNKAGMLLMALTAARDPRLLSELRSQALDSLIEMARWHDPGHAYPYRELLGRIARLDDDRISDLIASGQVEKLIAAAEKNGNR